jgi:hypothetical protein
MRRRGLYRASGPSLTYGRYLRWLSRYAKAVGINDLDFWDALDTEMRPYRGPLSYGVAAASYHLERVRGRFGKRTPQSPMSRESDRR